MEEKTALAELVAELIDDDAGYNGRDAPGHQHVRAGHWDSSGNVCSLCAAWTRVLNLLSQQQPEK